MLSVKSVVTKKLEYPTVILVIKKQKELNMFTILLKVTYFFVFPVLKMIFNRSARLVVALAVLGIASAVENNESAAASKT